MPAVPGRRHRPGGEYRDPFDLPQAVVPFEHVFTVQGTDKPPTLRACRGQVVHFLAAAHRTEDPGGSVAGLAGYTPGYTPGYAPGNTIRCTARKIVRIETLLDSLPRGAQSFAYSRPAHAGIRGSPHGLPLQVGGNPYEVVAGRDGGEQLLRGWGASAGGASAEGMA